MRHDRADLRVVPPADAAHLFSEPAVAHDEPGVQRITLRESLEILHRHADVQIVRARGEQILAGRRRLARHRWIDGGIEEQRAQAGEQRVERFAPAPRHARARTRRGAHRGVERIRRARQDEFPRGQVVVRARVDPEDLRVAMDRVERRRIDAVGVRDDGFEDVPHLEAVGVPLIVEDVAARERRLVKVPDQRALAERERAESIRVHLHDGGLANLLEQVLPVGRRAGERRLGRRVTRHRVVKA